MPSLPYQPNKHYNHDAYNQQDACMYILTQPPLWGKLQRINDSRDFFFSCPVRKTSTDALQLVVERCAAASTEGPCDQMIAVLK